MRSEYEEKLIDAKAETKKIKNDNAKLIYEIKLSTETIELKDELIRKLELQLEEKNELTDRSEHLKMIQDLEQ